MDDQQHQDALQTLLKRRLRILETQAQAQAGHTPPHVLMEIEDIQAQLRHQLPETRQAVVVAKGLFSALRDLDNAIRGSLKDLLLFRPEWSQQRREKVIEEINAFANREHCIDDVRAALRHLQQYLQTAHGADVPLLRQLFDYGSAFMRGLGKDVTPFPDYNTLRSFLLLVETADTTEAAAEVVQKTTQTLDILNRERLAEMRDIVSQLEFTQHGGV